MEDQNNNRWSQTHLCNEDEEQGIEDYAKLNLSALLSCAELH